MLHSKVAPVRTESRHHGASPAAGQTGRGRSRPSLVEEDVSAGGASRDAPHRGVEVEGEIAVRGLIGPRIQGAKIGKGQAGDRLVTEFEETGALRIEGYGFTQGVDPIEPPAGPVAPPTRPR